MWVNGRAVGLGRSRRQWDSGSNVLTSLPPVHSILHTLLFIYRPTVEWGLWGYVKKTFALNLASWEPRVLDFLDFRGSLGKVLSHSVEGSLSSSLWGIHCSFPLGLQCSFPKGWINFFLLLPHLSSMVSFGSLRFQRWICSAYFLTCGLIVSTVVGVEWFTESKLIALLQVLLYLLLWYGRAHDWVLTSAGTP